MGSCCLEGLGAGGLGRYTHTTPPKKNTHTTLPKKNTHAPRSSKNSTHTTLHQDKNTHPRCSSSQSSSPPSLLQQLFLKKKRTIGRIQFFFFFKSERELKKHDEWQNSQLCEFCRFCQFCRFFRFCRFCQFCWPCRSCHFCHFCHLCKFCKFCKCCRFCCTQTRSHAHGHTQDRQHKGNSAAKEDCSVLLGRSERAQSVAGRAQPAREGQFCGHRGLLLTFGKVGEKGDLIAHSSTQVGRRIRIPLQGFGERGRRREGGLGRWWWWWMVVVGGRKEVGE